MTRTHDVAAASAAGADSVVPVDEPRRPHRIRRPSDGLRFLGWVVGLAGVLVLADLAQQTTKGLTTDIAGGARQAPHLFEALIAQASIFWVLAVPVVFAAERLLRRDGLRVAIGLLAAVVAVAVTVLLDEWVLPIGPGNLADSLIWGRRGSSALHVDITPVIAFVTAARLTGRPRWQLATWGVIALAALAALTAGYASVAALAATYCLGRAIGYGALYALGSPNPRPPGTAVAATLDRLGLAPVRAARVDDDTGDARRYVVEVAGDDGPLDVTVLDRDQQSAGLPYRLWRMIRLRGDTGRRAVRSLRRSLEQESLMAYAVTAAGVRTPQLLATAEVGTEAALLAYRHVPGRTFDTLDGDEITDELLIEIWRQLAGLQAARLAHRRLEGDALLVDAQGMPWIIGLRTGETAVGDLVLRLDLAQLLTTLALRAGAERTVRTAVQVLEPAVLAATVPLLQRVALSRATRAVLRRRKTLLTRIREQIVALEPEIEIAPIRLERFRPRTIVSLVALTFAFYIVVTQLSNVRVGDLLVQARWEWAAVALLAAAVTYPAAALMLIGFVPERLSLGRTVLVQLAASFVKLVAPAAVTGVAVNTRFLQRSGIRPGPAVASVGASQLMGLAVHILLLLAFGFISGSARAAADLAPSRTIIFVVLAAGVTVAIGAAVGPLRRLVVGRLRSMFAGVVPRLLDVLQSPRKILTGLGGTLLLTVGFVVCLDASVRAFGGDLAWTSVVIVFLTGNALGSAAPTPGGLGAVEGALTFGLTISGLPAETATSAVLLFRLLTLWLPVLPGWAAFAYLQRKELI